jgi:CheY-like chemotaxis protein
MLALVDDVLDLARIEVGRIALTREEVKLDALIHETVAIVRDYIVAKGLDLRIHVGDLVEPVWIDRLRIRQVLLNLLVNAARHTTHGRIAVDATAEQDEILISVTDTGMGISTQDLPQVFQEFRTTEQPFSEWHSGTGLGLPISKKFVELHRGRMGVESTQGIGTRFWFTLPCTPYKSERPTQGRERYHPLVRLGASERIVVVVHPEPSTVSLFRRHLDGYRVIGAGHVEEGIALAGEVRALAILTDQARPAGHIPEDLLWVRFSLPSGGALARRLGAQYLLVKPVARRELLAAIAYLQVPTRRILIVDDDPEVVRLFRRMLHAQLKECDYVEAYSGAEALRRMRATRPDLVLLDLVMPEVDGQTVLAAMAADPVLAGIPVILVSARGQDQANLRVTDAIQIERPYGFELGELIQALCAALNALAPGWYGLDTHAPMHPKVLAG